MRKFCQRGMTLVETLVALVILAGVAIAAYAMAAQSTRFASAEQERLIAGIVADNRAAETLIRPAPPDQGEETEIVEAAGRKWAVKRAVSEAGEGLLRVEVTVTRETDAQVLARVDAVRATP